MSVGQVNQETSARIVVAVAVRQAIKRHGVLSILEESPGISVSATCQRVDELVAVLVRMSPEIVLLDAELMSTSAGSLLEVCGQLLEEHPTVGLLVMSAGLSEAMMLELLRLGVSGHLHYDISPGELTDAVRAACRGHSALDPRSVGSLVHAVRADRTDFEQPLITKHRTILRLAAEGRSDQEIAKRLVVSVSTVKQQFARIRRILEAVDRTHAVYVAAKRGWI